MDHRVKSFSLGRTSSILSRGFKHLSLAVPNDLRIQHPCDIIPKAQSWMVLNLMFVTFVYVLAFFNLICVLSVIQLMNTPFITFVL